VSIDERDAGSRYLGKRLKVLTGHNPFGGLVKHLGVPVDVGSIGSRFMTAGLCRSARSARRGVPVTALPPTEVQLTGPETLPSKKLTFSGHELPDEPKSHDLDRPLCPEPQKPPKAHSQVLQKTGSHD